MGDKTSFADPVTFESNAWNLFVKWISNTYELT